MQPDSFKHKPFAGRLAEAFQQNDSFAEIATTPVNAPAAGNSVTIANNANNSSSSIPSKGTNTNVAALGDDMDEYFNESQYDANRRRDELRNKLTIAFNKNIEKIIDSCDMFEHALQSYGYEKTKRPPAPALHAKRKYLPMLTTRLVKLQQERDAAVRDYIDARDLWIWD
jgi:hypothetical protein